LEANRLHLVRGRPYARTHTGKQTDNLLLGFGLVSCSEYLFDFFASTTGEQGDLAEEPDAVGT